MTVVIPAGVAQSITELAKVSGTTPEELLIRTLQMHFPPMFPELKAESNAWEQASDEDLLLVDLLIEQTEPS